MKTDYDYLRPTDRRKKMDLELVFAVLRETQGSFYNVMFNPFEAGTLRHERFERHYKREQTKWVDMEARFADLAEVYGEFRPDRLGMIPKRYPFNLLPENKQKEAISRLIAESGVLEE